MASAHRKGRYTALAAMVAVYAAGTVIAVQPEYLLALAHHDVPVP